jgi:hypothetical protein
MNKSYTFNDFNILILRGRQRFLSYTEYVVKNFGCGRAKRRKMLQYHYKNIYNNFES